MRFWNAIVDTCLFTQLAEMTLTSALYNASDGFVGSHSGFVRFGSEFKSQNLPGLVHVCVEKQVWEPDLRSHTHMGKP